MLPREGKAAMRPDLPDASALDTLLALLVSYEPLEVLNLCKAIEQFSVDGLHLAGNLRTELPPHCAQILSRKAGIGAHMAL
jgi:hypothetical protein